MGRILSVCGKDPAHARSISSILSMTRHELLDHQQAVIDVDHVLLWCRPLSAHAEPLGEAGSVSPASLALGVELPLQHVPTPVRAPDLGRAGLPAGQRTDQLVFVIEGVGQHRHGVGCTDVCRARPPVRSLQEDDTEPNVELRPLLGQAARTAFCRSPRHTACRP